MKKYNREQLRKADRAAYQKHKKKVRRRLVKAEKIEQFKNFRRLYVRRASDIININYEYIPLVVPEHLSLTHNRSESINFINEIREIVLSNKMPIFLHFSKCRKIGSSAALILAAEIFRCRYLRRFRNKKSVHGEYPNDPEVLSLLLKLGFFESIEVGAPNAQIVEDLDRYVKIQSFTRVDAALAYKVSTSLMSAFPHLGRDSQKKMQGAIVEALGNAFEHAFDKKPPFPVLGSRAWVGAIVKPNGKQFTLMVFDQGAGIPATLEPNILERLQSLGFMRSGGGHDSVRIEAATHLRRTSTRQQGRGKGFETMKRFVDSCDDGELRVFSNKGCYLYRPGGDTTFDDTMQTLGGTLVLWRIRHEGTEIADHG